MRWQAKKSVRFPSHTSTLALPHEEWAVLGAAWTHDEIAVRARRAPQATLLRTPFQRLRCCAKLVSPKSRTSTREQAEWNTRNTRPPARQKNCKGIRCLRDRALPPSNTLSRSVAFGVAWEQRKVFNVFLPRIQKAKARNSWVDMKPTAWLTSRA